MTTRRESHPETAQAEPIRGPAASKPERGSPLAGGLYLVATPIGNLGDVTHRALDILSKVQAVACEDTRVTGRLLARYGLEARLVSYNDANAARVRPALVARVARGEAVALVSDAGTPLVSDPGYKLVRALREAGLPVTAAPGPSAALTALVVSGLPPDRFCFLGFLPRGAARRAAIAPFAALPASLILYESPQRLAECLADLTGVLGDREAVVARELTKLYEEVVPGTLSALARRYAEAGPPKGEVVIVIAPPGEAAEPEGDEIDRLLSRRLGQGLSVRDAAAEVAREAGLPRRTVYARALALAEGGGPGDPETPGAAES